MAINWKSREFIATVASIFGTTKTARRHIRDRIRFRGMLSDAPRTHLPVKKYSRRINVAFCFNDNGYKLACVSIRSLVMASDNRCDYDIYCVVDRGVSQSHRHSIERMIRGTKSRIIFLTANHDFDSAYRGGWPAAMWWRLQLPKLLPQIDQIIYADIDVIFCDDLIELSRLDMGHNLLAGVRDYPNGYINSGVLVMNLKEMRRTQMYDKWLRVAHTKKYKNPDQDMLNYTSRGRIIFLPLKYNFQTMLGKWIFRTHSEYEINELKYNLVVIHYSNWLKPWYAPNMRPMFSEIWWRVARDTGLF